MPARRIKFVDVVHRNALGVRTGIGEWVDSLNSGTKFWGGSADGNIEFHSLCHLLIRPGFDERVKGGHHIFTMIGTDEIINLQARGGKVKPYQVKQVRSILVKYRLGESNVDQV